MAMFKARRLTTDFTDKFFIIGVVAGMLTITGCASHRTDVTLPVASPATTDVQPKQADSAQVLTLQPEHALTKPLGPRVPATDAAVRKEPKRHNLSQEDFISMNEENLLYIYLDMPKSQVKAIMNGYHAGHWVNPCWQEVRKDAQDNRYEVVFYLSRNPTPYRPIGERIMTPVIFKGSLVYGLGRYGLKKLRASTQLIEKTSLNCEGV